MTRFSVVLPVFNRAASLGPALESVLKQTRPADEIIVVDDGSSDDILTALAPYEGQIRLLRQENSGAAAARNFGALAATGDWLTFQDSDDLWTETHLASLARDIEAAGSHVVCHLGDVTYVGDGYRKSLFEIKGLTFPNGSAVQVDDPLPLVISGMTLQGSAIRRDLFNRMGGLNVTMRMLEDTAFFCLLALEGAFLVTADEMALIQRLADDEIAVSSLSRKDALGAAQMYMRVFEPLLQRELRHDHRQLVSRMLAGAEFGLAQVLHQSDPVAERRMLLQSARRHPRAIVGWTKAALAFCLGARGYRMVLDRRRALDRS